MFRSKSSRGNTVIAGLCFTLTALFLVFLFAGRVYIGYAVNRDIDALIDRTQVSADSEDMLANTRQLRENMLAYGLDQGHSALIFKTPLTDFSLTFKAVEDLIVRIEQINKLPKDTTAYQVGLDDLRGTIRELPNPGAGYLWVRYDFWLIPLVLVLVIGGFIFAIILGWVD